MSKPIRTLIADDDYQFIAQLVACLNGHPQIEVVGTASDGQGALDMYLETLPDVVVLSLQLPIIDGVRTTQALLENNAQMGILVISSTDADDYVLQAVKMGAKGYLRKADALEGISEAIEQVYEGDVYIPSDLASLMLNEFDRLA